MSYEREIGALRVSYSVDEHGETYIGTSVEGDLTYLEASGLVQVLGRAVEEMSEEGTFDRD